MYVVVEFNQASHQPRVYYDDPYDNLAEAREAVAECEAEIRTIGRRERYAVYELVEVD